MEKARLRERDLSWLAFNERVLQEAKDPTVPLYERLKFLAIYSSNLDEFFRVRVASMRSFKEMNKEDRKALDIKPKKILKKIKPIVKAQQKEFGRIFQKEIIPELAMNKIHLISEIDYSENQGKFARDFFEDKVKEHLNPILLEDGVASPFLENRELYLIIELEEEEALYELRIPSKEVGRFCELPQENGQFYITALDDIIRYNLSSLFSEKTIKSAHSIKVSRDAELYLGDEFSGNLIERLKEHLKHREKGLPTRFLYDQSMSKDLVKRLKEIFQLSKYDLMPGGRYHNFNDFFGFPNPTGKKELHDQNLSPKSHAELDTKTSLLDAIQEKDYLLNFPYQSYSYIPKLIWESADDPKVEEIKITLYRVASKSEVTKALLHALEVGKKVLVFIEAKARFDESSNLYWGEQLEKAGANVIYSYPGIKVHTKLLVIRRREKGALKNYAYIGTGNFNEKTAKLYCDHALLTADIRLANEVLQVFELLERKIIVPKTKHVMISPFSTRSGFEKLIDKEISHAKSGKEAYMILKMNSLEDPKMIEKLYEASNAGVKIKMIIRGFCCLIPQVEGMSENIEVISIIDRFLEHARVYIFANGGKEKMYLASADWMTRNIDRRVEVVFPIYDAEVYQQLREIINLQLADNVKARIIDQEEKNKYVINDLPKLSCQRAIYDLMK